MVQRVLNRLVAACVLGAAVAVGSAAPAAAATTAVLVPASGPPGMLVKVDGSGFGASTRVDVFFDTTDVARAVSNAAGVVTMGIHIPTTAQPGTHWITLDEVRTHAAAQAQFTVVTSWPQGGYGPSGRNFNPLENTVDASNANQLTVAWSRPLTDLNDFEPFVVLRENVYVFESAGTLSAFSSSGALLWHAAAGPSSHLQATPVAGGSSVFVGNANGVVRAYPYLCRTDGGLCTTTQWVANISTTVNGLTLRNGLLYASGSDGLVHVMKASNGGIGVSVSSQGSGPVTQPVAFAPDGGTWIVKGTRLTGPRISMDFGFAVSAPAVDNTDAYVTTKDGYLRGVPTDGYGGPWSTSIGKTAGCDTPPAFAKGIVYAAGCDSIGAFDPDTGDTLWSVALPTPWVSGVSGLTVANGVVYACWNFRARAYDARDGNRIGSGGRCTLAPEMVNGILYSDGYGSIYAATMDGANNTLSITRPDPSQLRPSARVPRQKMH